MPGFEGAKHLNPQWTPDGASLYFVSDPDGISNIYRVRLADGELRQVTNLYTGVSGITETSPAFSVAQRSGRLAYSVFRTNGYELYAVDSPEILAGRPVPPVAGPLAAVLPPVVRTNDKLVAPAEGSADRVCRPTRRSPPGPIAQGSRSRRSGSRHCSPGRASSAPTSEAGPRSISATSSATAT